MSFMPEPPEHPHPQQPIDNEGGTADTVIAPLIILARRHGLAVLFSCQGGEKEPPYDMAYILFATAAEAMEFLTQSAHLVDYQVADKMALTVIRPLAGAAPAGRVLWHPEFTPQLILAWSEGARDGS